MLASAFLQFAAAVPLAIYAAVMHSRLRHLGVTAPGPTIGLVGGIVAATMMAFAGLVTWTLTLPGVAAGGAALVMALHGSMFATGGVGAVAFLGLLVAGVAVPGWLSGALPRTFALVGIAIAAIAELAILSRRQRDRLPASAGPLPRDAVADHGGRPDFAKVMEQTVPFC